MEADVVVMVVAGLGGGTGRIYYIGIVIGAFFSLLTWGREYNCNVIVNENN